MHLTLLYLKRLQNKGKKPWITSGILKSIKYKNKLFGKFIKFQEKFWYEKYKYPLHVINKLISKSKKSYFRKSVQENHSKSKIIWTKINEIIQSKIREHEDDIQMNIVSFLKKLILMKFTKHLKI